MVIRNTSRTLVGAFALALVVPCSTARASDTSFPTPTPPAAPTATLIAGEKGAPGLAIKTRKVLTVPLEGTQYFDNAVVLVKDGKITAVGPAASTPIPAGFETIDAGEQWIMPGMIDLHSHVGGTFDINEMVYLTNPGLRVSTSVIPHNDTLKVAIASGVTSILFIPGSGVNVGGQGVLIKTGHDKYEDALIRNPGSMKLAQAGNPEGWTIGVGRSFMNWNTRAMFSRGMLYAQKWEAFEKGKGPKPERNFDLDIFRELHAKRTQISTHTQIFQVVMTTLTMVRQQFGIDVYIDHGEMAGYKLAGFAKELGVNAIIGPRNVEVPTRGFINWTGSNPEGILGIAAEYQKRGMKMIGFNTDAPVIPAEELFLQAGMAIRHGFDATNLESVRGLTIVPAVTAGIADRVGSIEVGKDADFVIMSGDPADPRTAVQKVFIDGKRVYDTAKDKRLF
ncbi:MAG: amidohydrolase family protein [Planctomycetes bacterium]|nr:amidohydrolase family protein [Planctomycetota bacterium]